ncbi:L,D-transpeptidase family protein [bacterium]|nr:L,D-transpeptidase family protein [bacterium]
MKKVILSLFIIFVAVFVISFLIISNSNPENRARKYIELAFKEYKLAIKKSPGNKELLNEYASILKIRRGESESKIELALLFHNMSMEKEGDNLLLEVMLKDKAKAIEHLEHLISQAKHPTERIVLTSAILKIAPENGDYWYQLGRLYLGMNRHEEGIESLEKAHSKNVKEEDLFYYLGLALIQRGDYKKAELYINEGLKEGDSVELHKLRYSLYSKQKRQEFAAREKEKISQLLSKKTLEEKVPIEKPSPVTKPVAEKPIVMPGIIPYTFLYVNKGKQELLVYNVDNKGMEIVKKFPVTTGKNSGPKELQGDEKTPHGAYLLTSKIDGSSLPAKYGIAAYPMNYPNHIDRRLKRSGNGIWLHGTPIDRPPYNSEGCIVLNDNDLKSLMEYITARKTFISIEDNLAQLTPKLFNDVLASVDKWKTGWESLDIDKYMATYDEAFYSGGKDKKQYKIYKAGVNKGKTYINVELSDVQILPYGKTPFGEMTLVFFRQKYKASNFSSTTSKILYMVKRAGNWKVIAEEVI